MLLRELFESDTKHVTFCFGRMNPPTIGHKQVLDTMKAQGGDMMIFVSQSQDAKKNPLDYGTKIKFIKEMFPEYAGDVVENASLNTVVKVASFLHEQGYNAATFVAGSDRLEDMKKLLNTYNGVEGKSHGFYKFDVLDFVSSGDREDGAEGVAGVSASGAREAAANNDFEKFKTSTGAGELAKPLFAAVRKGMNISESIIKEQDMRAKDIIPASKPRNFVAKNQKTAGAGAHKDKKKALKQGDVKHKKQEVEEAGMYRRPGSPSAYDRDYRSSVSGMGKRDSLAYRMDGGANDEGEDDAPYQHPEDKPVLKGYYFYDVPPGKEGEAAIYGVKKTKNGKWAKALYSTSGRSFSFQKQGADKAFGPGKFWSPKK